MTSTSVLPGLVPGIPVFAPHDLSPDPERLARPSPVRSPVSPSPLWGGIKGGGVSDSLYTCGAGSPLPEGEVERSEGEELQVYPERA